MRQWPQQPPPPKSRVPVPVAVAAGLVVVVAAGAVVWFLLGRETPQKTAKVIYSRAPRPTIAFVPTEEEQAFMALAKKTGRANVFAGDDLGLLNYGRRVCGLPSRLPGGSLAQNDSEPPTIDSILAGPPLKEGPAAQAVSVMCPKHIKILIQGALSFPEGSWQVGPERTETEIEPGLYRTTQHVQECTWIRTTKAGKEITGSGGGRVTVRIAKSDAEFVSDGCGNWGFERK